MSRSHVKEEQNAGRWPFVAIIAFLVVTALIASTIMEYRRLNPTAPREEMAWLRHHWSSSLLLLALSLSTKTTVVILTGWGSIRQAIWAALAAYFASLSLPLFPNLFVVIGNPYDLMLLPGLVMWWHQIFIFWLPVAFLVEGLVFSAMSRGISSRRPWLTAAHTNLADFAICNVAVIFGDL